MQFADWDESVAGVPLDRFCASGLEAVNMAAMKIASGWEDLVVADGVESMSRVPMGSGGDSWMSDPEVSIHLNSVPQGVGADTIATLGNWGEKIAVESKKRAAHARNSGYFDASVVSVKDLNGGLF